MKILHIAYRLDESSAATRLAKTQTDRHEIYFLLGRLSKSQFVRKRQVYPLLGSIIGIALHSIEIVLFSFLKIAKDEIFSFGITGLPQRLLVGRVLKAKKIDIIHLHWGGYSFFPLSAAFNLPVPLVATAHDYNLFTGGCHIPMACDNFKEACNICPLTSSKMAQSYIRHIKSKNSRALEKIRPTITAPSRYTNMRIREVFPFLNTTVVGNTLGDLYDDQTTDCVVSKGLYKQARPTISDVPTLITVGTVKSARQNKGQDVLEYVLANLYKCGIEFNYISIGRYDEYKGIAKRTHFDTVTPQDLKKLYAVSDLCLVPSRYETFSQVSLESILCGTPVIAFDNSGPNDIVAHGKTGFLVSAFDQFDFFQTTSQNLNFKFNNLDSIFCHAEVTAHKYSPGSISRCFDNIYNQ